MGLWNSIQQTYLSSATVPYCIFALLQHFDIANSQHFTATLWSLWKHRNLKLWQDVNETAAQVMDRAFHLIEHWSSANSTTQDLAPPSAPQRGLVHANHNSSSSSLTDTVWQRPSSGRLKCNIDASFYNSLNRTGIGVCIRDDEGSFVMAKTINFCPKCSVPLGEALGLLHALRWLRDLRKDNIDFVSDSKIVIEAFHRQRPDVTEFGQVMSVIRSLFTLSFTNSRVEFSRRQANEVAHALVRVAPFSAS
jgi:ribonuclease HI